MAAGAIGGGVGAYAAQYVEKAIDFLDPDRILSTVMAREKFGDATSAIAGIVAEAFGRDGDVAAGAAASVSAFRAEKTFVMRDSEMRTSRIDDFFNDMSKSIGDVLLNRNVSISSSPKAKADGVTTPDDSAHNPALEAMRRQVAEFDEGMKSTNYDSVKKSVTVQYSSLGGAAQDKLLENQVVLVTPRDEGAHDAHLRAA